jgi:hypothetical protein
LNTTSSATGIETDPDKEAAEESPVATAIDGTAGSGSKKPWIITGAIMAVAVVVALLFAIGSGGPTKIEEAAEDCGLTRNVGDDGTSITVRTKGDDDPLGDSYSDLVCLFDEMAIPDRIVSQIGQTRALDGTLSASWDEFEAFWNYHPDSGANLTIYVP